MDEKIKKNLMKIACKARKGVIEYWKSIQRSSDIWNQYKETGVSVLSEIEE